MVATLRTNSAYKGADLPNNYLKVQVGLPVAVGAIQAKGFAPCRFAAIIDLLNIGVSEYYRDGSLSAL